MWANLIQSWAHLATAKLTSLFSPYWGGLGLRGLPSSQDEEGSGCSGHRPDPPASGPSGVLPCFLERQDLFCQGWWLI